MTLVECRARPLAYHLRNDVLACFRGDAVHKLVHRAHGQDFLIQLVAKLAMAMQKLHVFSIKRAKDEAREQEIEEKRVEDKFFF